MKYSRNSMIAMLMVVTALLGWLICLVGLLGIWSFYPRMISSLDNLSGLANRSLDTTDQLLNIVDNTIKTSAETISQIKTSLEDVSNTFGNTSPLFDSAAKMVGTDFSKMAEDTRVALVSLANTAKTIDDTLRFISSFPLIGQPYNPSVPLDTSIVNLATSIEALPSNLKDIQSWLAGTERDLKILKQDTAQLAKSIETVTPQLSTALQVMTQYHKLVQDLRSEVINIKSRLTQILSLLAVSLSIFLVWLALAQVGNFAQGLERLQASQIDSNIAAQDQQSSEDDLLESAQDPTEN